MLPIQPMRKVSFVRIEIVQNNISIRRATCCKNNDLRKTAQSFEKLLAMRTHSYACLNNSTSTETVLPPSTGKSNLTVQLLVLSSQWIRVSSRSRQTVFNLGFFLASLISLIGLGVFMFLLSLSAYTVWRKCCRVNAARQPLSFRSKDLATLPIQYREPASAELITLISGFQTYLFLSEGSLSSFLTLLPLFFSTSLSVLFLPINLSRVKLLVDLIFAGSASEFYLALQAPILLSMDELTSRSQVLLLKEYLYLGALMESSWQLLLRINYIYQTYETIIVPSKL